MTRPFRIPKAGKGTLTQCVVNREKGVKKSCGYHVLSSKRSHWLQVSVHELPSPKRAMSYHNKDAMYIPKIG